LMEEEDLSQMPPPAKLQSSASGIWTDMSLSNEEMEIPDNIFEMATSIEIEEPRDASLDAVNVSTAESSTSTSVGVKTPSNVFGGILVGDVNSSSSVSSSAMSAAVSSAVSSAMNSWRLAVVQPQPIIAAPIIAASAIVPTVAAPLKRVSCSRTPSPVSSSSEDEDGICDVESEDDESCNGSTECKKCAKMFEMFVRDPKNKLGKLSPADELLTDDMYKKYMEKSVNMDTKEKASHIDLYFKLRDIKALRKMVGIHNKSHFTKSKPSHVESTTRLLGQKYILTRVCVEDPSIPFRKFLKAKKAAGRSKPSRSARQATQPQPKKASPRYSPY